MMVFFTCSACGASLKKNQVEKHYQSECRNCEVLSCMDCGKDFFGNEYASHTKCISEAEKYQGALFSGGGGATKGEKKQEEWLERVKQSSSTAKVSGRVASLLEKIAEYPNVPRKRKKFENFVRNSINVRDETTLSQVWEAFSEATKPVPSQSNGDNKIEPASTPPHDVIATGTETEDKLTTHTSVLEVSELMKEKKKKSKKLKKCPMELEELSTQQSMQEDDIKKKTKKSKKQAESKDLVDRCQLNGIVESVTMTSDDARKKKKKGKKDESVNTKEKRKRNHGDEDIQSRTKKLKRTD